MLQVVVALVSAMVVRRAPTPTLLASSSFAESAGWPPLRDSLDQLPVFTVADAEGKPLQYEVDGEKSAVFYADVDQAKEELATAKAQFPNLEGIDIIPVGLGGAYLATTKGDAVLIPGRADLTRAGCPENAPAVGQPLPLFACMEMSRESSDGSGQPVLPLFMCHADCAEAVAQATASDLGEDEDPLEIVGLSLPSVVERLSSVADETPAFTFVPPSASAEFIRNYLESQAP